MAAPRACRRACSTKRPPPRSAAGSPTGGELDEAAMEQTLEALARFRAAGQGNGAQEAPHRRHRGGARRQQWRRLPQARRRARAQAALAVGGGGSRTVGARRHFGQSARARHRRRPWRGQPRAGRGRARRGGGGGVAPARRAARRRRARPGQRSREPIRADRQRRAGSRMPRAGMGSTSSAGRSARSPCSTSSCSATRCRSSTSTASRTSGSPSSRERRAQRKRRGAQGAHRPVGRPASPRCPPRRRSSRAMIEVLGPARIDHLGVRAARGHALPRPRRATRAPKTRCSRRRSRSASGSGGSAIMAPRSTSGSIPCSRTKAPTTSGCGSPPACSATSAGTRIPISAPSARSTWRCTAIGSGSTPTAARCSGAPCAARSAATAGSASSCRRLLKPGRG